MLCILVYSVHFHVTHIRSLSKDMIGSFLSSCCQILTCSGLSALNPKAHQKMFRI